MKKGYSSPELEIISVQFVKDALIVSSTSPSAIDQPIPTGGATVPDDDPF